MPTASSRADLTNRPSRSWDQRIDQGGLANAGVPDKDAAVPSQLLPQRIQIGTRKGHLNWDPERLILRDEFVRGG